MEADGDQLCAIDNIHNETLDAAPSFPGAIDSDHTNNITMSYRASEDLMKYVPCDLWDAFKECYGLVKITRSLVKMLKYCADGFLVDHVGVKPEFNGSDNDAIYARLLLLLWWSKYALKKYGKDAYILLH